MNSTAGFENIDKIKFTNPRKVTAWIFWKRVVVDFVVDPMMPTFQYRRVNGDVIQLPDLAGTTDFASTPPVLWWIKWFVPCRFSYSATIHDQAYLHHHLIINGTRTLVTREYCDCLLEECIEHEPDPGTPAEAWTYKKGVRLFGAWYWGKDDDPVEPVGKIDISKLMPSFA